MLTEKLHDGALHLLIPGNRSRAPMCKVSVRRSPARSRGRWCARSDLNGQAPGFEPGRSTNSHHARDGAHGRTRTGKARPLKTVCLPFHHMGSAPPLALVRQRWGVSSSGTFPRSGACSNWCARPDSNRERLHPECSVSSNFTTSAFLETRPARSSENAPVVKLVDPAGIEPATPCLQGRCSPK